jgi:heme o synthase
VSVGSRVREYYTLTKPGIIRGNAITTTAGFLLASKGSPDWLLLFTTLLGASLVVAAGCVYNNVLDRGIDEKMVRTKYRALVTGTISIHSSITFGTLLCLAGFGLLVTQTNTLTALIGLVGIIFYVAVYGAAKRRSVHGTVVGSISGAIPPVAGYTAVTGQVDIIAALLFLILVCWQMPHFYSIALYRSKEYAAAGIPVLPLAHGIAATQRQIIIYILLFIGSALSLWAIGYTGYTYAVAIALAGLWWLRLGFKGLQTTDTSAWARRMFGSSLMVISVLSLMLSIDAMLP